MRYLSLIHILNLMNGTIKVDSTLHKGTKITVTIYLEPVSYTHLDVYKRQAGYGLVMAVVCSLIVAVVTFVICEIGLCLGKTLGTKLSGKADVLGGVILIGIGIVSWGRGM